MRFLFLFFSACLIAKSQDLPGVPDPVGPVPGPLLLCGSEGFSPTVASTVAELAEGKEGRLIILCNDLEKASAKRALWKNLLSEVQILELRERAQAESPDFVKPLKDATGVWLDADFSEFAVGTLLEQELKALSRRAWVIAGCGQAAESLGEQVRGQPALRPGFSFLPSSIIHASEREFPKGPQSPKVTNLVTWEIPPQGVMVVHEGRRIGVLGSAEITARVSAHNGWPERIESFAPPRLQLPFATDLFSWTRSAKARSGPVFPPENPPIPEVKSGTLILIGGGGSTEDMWERFVKEAGGPLSNFVCIVQSPESSIPGRLRKMGCDKVTVLQSDLALRAKADSNKEFLRTIEEADGIFFGGGRTFRFMDTYQQTAAHRAMFRVLERGGVIAGTSAGAQIQGDFLVRGNPQTNQTLWYPGNDTGLGFLRGVIIDVHFAERNRERTLPPLLKEHRGMVGLGIDEASAVVIKGFQAEVLGKGAAWFWDNGNTSKPVTEQPVVLRAGGVYDFKTGQLVEK